MSTVGLLLFVLVLVAAGIALRFFFTFGDPLAHIMLNEDVQKIIDQRDPRVKLYLVASKASNLERHTEAKDEFLKLSQLFAETGHYFYQALCTLRAANSFVHLKDRASALIQYRNAERLFLQHPSCHSDMDTLTFSIINDDPYRNYDIALQHCRSQMQLLGARES